MKPKAKVIDPASLRLIALTAVVSDDWLMTQLVLKGGCALELVHDIGGRSSLDIDFSIAGDFDDPDEVGRRLGEALTKRFAIAGYIVFDFRFAPRPEDSATRAWGGYRAVFKLIQAEKHATLKGDLEASRRNALPSGPNNERVFSIDVSKFEYCEGKVLATVQDFDVYVYSPAMIAAEKLRAICQQQPGYPQRKNPSPRPRDFYDIHSIATDKAVALVEHPDLIAAMFAAKDVPLRLIESIVETRDFHEPAWPSVRDAIAHEVEDFGFYFDFVVSEGERLKSVWDV